MGKNGLNKLFPYSICTVICEILDADKNLDATTEYISIRTAYESQKSNRDTVFKPCN